MSRGINKVILVGNVGGDPEVRYSAEGTAFASFSLATSENWKDRNGQPQERTEWHRISVAGKLAEITQQYIRKGSKLYVEGQLRTRKWQANDGTDRYTTEVHVGFNGQIQMLDGRTESSSAQPRQNQPPAQSQGFPSYQQGRAPQQQQPQAGGPFNDAFDDQIPF